MLEKPEKPIKVRPNREPRAAGRGRLNHVRIEIAEDAFGNTAREQRRAVMWKVIADLGTPTHEEAVNACLLHPEVQITPNTARWHIRQMVQVGQLREVSV